MATKSLQIKKGFAYQLDDGRIGTLKFIGSTFFKPGVTWYGFELAEGFEGKNDGSVKGVEYFKCKKGKGVFVKKEKIVARSSSRKAKTDNTKIRKQGALETGRNDYKGGEKYDIKDDGKGFLGEKNAKASTGKLSIKKDGSIATGRNKDYDAAKFETEDGAGNFLAEKVEKVSLDGKAEKKQGPIEIGRNED